MEKRPAFLDMPAPANYVAGLGRGATGFTTRSDIGPAKAGVAQDALKEESNVADLSDSEDRFQDAEDESGLLGRSLASYDAEDKEADRIYEAVDRRMQERRKAKQEEKDKLRQEEIERKNAALSDQFADLKRSLASVSAEEWAELPEVGDLTRKNKRQRREANERSRFYAVPDSVIAAARQGAEVATSIDDQDLEQESDKQNNVIADFLSISTAKDKMLSMRLAQTEQASKLASESGIDPKEYLTSLTSGDSSSAPGSTFSSSSAAQFGDINRVRPLLESLVRTQPNEARGWIGLTRLEELARNFKKAKTVIERGCEHCPNNQDVWMENLRINEDQMSRARVIAKQAVRLNPNSVDLWLAAARLEGTNVVSRKKVIKKALEENPFSDALWRAAVNLETESDDRRRLLAQAVELVPMSEELWLALAQLETPKNARKVLNKARKALKTSRAIWIAAAKLEEQDKHDLTPVLALMDRGVKQLVDEGAPTDVKKWMEDAQKCEREQALLTCKAIIYSVARHDRKFDGSEGISDFFGKWLELGKSCEANNSFETARSVYSFLIEQDGTNVNALNAALEMEKQHGSADSLFALLEQSVKWCPNVEELWVTYAQETAQGGDIDGARKVIERALGIDGMAENENIWLAAVDLETSYGYYNRAADMLSRARNTNGKENIWVRSVVFERQLAVLAGKDIAAQQNGNADTSFKTVHAMYYGALELADQGLAKYPRNADLYINKGDILRAMEDSAGAQRVYETGIKSCPQNVDLWLALSQIQGSTIKSRTVLDRAGLVNPKNELIWYHKVRLENENGNAAQAQKLMAKALQDCPKSGILWSTYIWMFPRMQRKTQIVEAIKRCEHDPYILLTAARQFWVDGKMSKVESWLDKAIRADVKNGDSWMWMYRYVMENGNEEDQQVILTDFEAADPDHGLEWEQSLKDVELFQYSKVELLQEAAKSLMIA